ncbi:RIP metalloprotease RseP [Reichenbachiella carrageenanivorans]|uniref:Zinc metalloprotease n=1 Tax=Reichenbachiella carrageenanivorans TaxID=2979869 RepID=A0ABY6CVL7_9BACT|nr:RIP metalloprotease RseP [Reichenbachiella carrageenanivorans]UXX77956.1 RIP metalloprotease RseP [Reichenbachiella carrageenanivorans]
MEGLIMTAQLLLGLSILVGVHEFGHLIAAKAFGMRVEKYSIGFPPKIWGFQYGETEYSFGAIPLGGFVKISGMIDESLDTESMSAEPEDWEFRAKPAWQRLIVMMGGIIVNVITGIIIFVFLVYSNGNSYIPKEELNKHGIVASELGQEIGLQTGDVILKVNGKDYDRFTDLLSMDVLFADQPTYQVKRNDSIFTLAFPDGFLNKLTDKKYKDRFIDFRFPYYVGDVLSGTEAAKGGLLAGDQILTVNNKPAIYFDQLKAILTANKDKDVVVTVKRADNSSKTLTFHVTTDGTIGFQPSPLIDYQHDEYSFGEAIPIGTTQAFNVVWANIKGLGKIFSGDVAVSKSLSGPIRIAQMFGGTWDWNKFWNMTGLLSMVLAFMNFLPIPALDGGHVVFLTYEIVSGRKPSDKFLENAQKVGMIILLSLMVFAFFNDIVQTIF